MSNKDKVNTDLVNIEIIEELVLTNIPNIQDTVPTFLRLSLDCEESLSRL